MSSSRDGSSAGSSAPTPGGGSTPRGTPPPAAAVISSPEPSLAPLHGYDSGPASRQGTRPSSASGGGAAAASMLRHHRGGVDDSSFSASEASRRAALEAQASVMREDGKGPVPSAPIGLSDFSHVIAAVNAASLMGLGSVTEEEDEAEAARQLTKVLVPRLDDLLIKHLAENYHVLPAFDWIPAEYIDNVIALLDPQRTPLDFATAVATIHTEKYWCRMAKERWDPRQMDLAKHGQSWKRLYCERHLKECLEKYHHSKNQHNYNKLLQEVEACKPYVHTLQLSELLSHIDLSDLLFDFPLLTSIDIKFGARQLGMDYDKSLFGMSLSDCVSMSKLLCHTSTLNRLVLSDNLLNDESVLLLLAGLHPSVNRTLTHLDLSHNRISDIGARRLAALLDGGASQAGGAQQEVVQGGGVNYVASVPTVLTELNLSDNRMGREGAIAFGQALANNRGLRSLNLSLNALGPDGGVALFNGCTQHTTLRELCLSSADLGGDASDALLNLLRFNRSLDSLVLHSNSLHGETGGESLLEALKDNPQIAALDMRRNGLAPAVEQDINSLLAKRTANVKQANRKAFQKDWDKAM